LSRKKERIYLMLPSKLPSKPKKALSKAIKYRNDLIEHLAAKGVPLQKISEQVGLTTTTLTKLLKQPESIARVEEVHRQMLSRVVSEAAGLGERFDAAAPDAADRLFQLSRGETDDISNPVPHAVSLQAVTQILDRAPSAPSKKGDNVDARQLHIHLPERQFANAQQALIDIGVAPPEETES
jgi:lambda repressor-like predicted transcriptional regulator